jgi:hypothetical protein
MADLVDSVLESVWARELLDQYIRRSIGGRAKLLRSSRLSWETCQRANCA